MIARFRLATGLVTGFALLSLIGCGKETDTSKAPKASESAPVDSPAPADNPGSTDSPEKKTGAEAAKRTAKPRPWPHESSDIPVDPRINFGHFDNGMRWAWANNPEPKKRCYIRLHVDVGSLGEEDNEVGLAHFLEHMAFNGSKNFAAGTLIEWFQENGMSFGADTNAHTAFSETVYKLDLPENDPETIREGLKVLRDFADGMTLAEKEVQAEKGVIDGEQRERDSAQFRIMEKQLDVMCAGTLLKDRLPIGEKAVRDKFTAASVRAFYERWYRPENMTLVAVGDFGDLDPVPLFEAAFADMPVPAGPVVAEPGPGTPDSFAHFYAIHETEVPTVRLSIDRLKPWVEEPVTVAEWLEDLPLRYARSMLNTRFRELAKEESAPFMSAHVSSSEFLKVFDGEGLNITCAPENWEDALAAGEQGLRRALEFGFQKAELAALRADALRSLDEQVEREATAPSRRLLGGILASAESPVVPMNAETRRKLRRPAIEALTTEACHEALKAAWAEGESSITATGNLDLGDDAGAQLRAAHEASTAVAVKAPEKIDQNVFAYSSDPAKKGKITAREHVEDLDFHTVTFENGVALNVKRTDFREKQIMLTVNFGEGQLTAEPKDMLALQMIGGAVLNGGGLEAHSNDDLRRLTAGKQVGFRFGIGVDRFVLSGGTTAEDLLLECELVCAQFTAPGWREDGLVQLRRRLPMMYASMEHQHQGPALLEFVPALYSGDPRFGFPPREVMDATGVDEVRAWLGPLLKDAPIEVTLIGDLDVEETIAFAARTFGMLPKRRDWNAHEERRIAPKPKTGLKQTHGIVTQIPKSLVLIVFPTTDGIDMTRRRRMNMLNQVVTDRLRIEVREKLGAAYSPGSMAQPSTVNPGVGTLMMQAMSNPENVDTLVKACLAVADSLAKDGVTDEELNRLREPVLNKRRDAKRTNPFWMQILSRAQSDSTHLDAMRKGDAFYEGVKPADLNPLASEFLKSERASILIVNPSPKE